MGIDKALLPIFGDPLLVHSAKVIASLKPLKLVITLSDSLFDNSDVKRDLSALGANIVKNSYPHLGYIGSIKTALHDVDNNLDGILILPVDNPLFSTSLIASMLACSRDRTNPNIVVPHFYVHAGHPVYLSKDFFHELKTRALDGLRLFIAKHKQFMHAFFWPDARLLLNLNTPRDILLCRRECFHQDWAQGREARSGGKPFITQFSENNF